MFELTDKVVVITGSTKGIGRAMAEQMAKAGAKVVVSSRKAEPCDEVAAAIVAAGGEAIAIPCHIGHKDQLQNLVDQTIAKWGRIDVMVCNAAANPFYGSLADIPDELFDKTMETNVRSNVWLANMVAPQMKERKDGVIIITSSIGGLKGDANLGAYAISKAADMQLARNLAVELGPTISASIASPPAWCAPTWPAPCGRTPTPTNASAPPPPCSASASPTKLPARRCSWPPKLAAS